MHENALLDSLRHLFASADPAVLTGSGPDDCAHLASVSGRLAVSADAFAEGSHFLADTPARDVARKALAASLSDLAASACLPRWALVSLCLRRGAGEEWARDFARGLDETARRYGVTVVGGDTVSADAAFVSVTVMGEPLPGGPVLRSGGRPGDILAVTGALGGSFLGRHLEPEPRLDEIARLMAFCARPDGPGVFPSAMMDISDGLALDLSRLCRESGTGANIDAAAVPISPDAVRTAASSGREPLWHALTDGEDFELLLALPPVLWEALAGGSAAGAGFTPIGQLTAGSALQLRLPGGEVRPLTPEGFEHQW